MTKESNLVAHARRELELAGLTPTPPLSALDKVLIALKLKKRPAFDYNGAIGAACLDLVRLFADQGHSGFSANATVRTAEKLMRFEPLTPLTGEDGEWNGLGDGWQQNRRCSHVFKENGEAYDSRGKVFRHPDGVSYTCHESRVPVTFPYTPTVEYVDVPAKEN